MALFNYAAFSGPVGLNVERYVAETASTDFNKRVFTTYGDTVLLNMVLAAIADKDCDEIKAALESFQVPTHDPITGERIFFTQDNTVVGVSAAQFTRKLDSVSGLASQWASAVTRDYPKDLGQQTQYYNPPRVDGSLASSQLIGEHVGADVYILGVRCIFHPETLRIGVSEFSESAGAIGLNVSGTFVTSINVAAFLEEYAPQCFIPAPARRPVFGFTDTDEPNDVEPEPVSQFTLESASVMANHALPLNEFVYKEKPTWPQL